MTRKLRPREVLGCGALKWAEVLGKETSATLHFQHCLIKSRSQQRCETLQKAGHLNSSAGTIK